MSMAISEQRRVTALLGLTGDTDAVEVEASPTGESLDALETVAYSWPGHGAQANVYVFDGYSAAAAALRALNAAVDREIVTVESTVNGGLLLWATAEIGDEWSQTRIDGMAQRFAGRE